MRIENIHYAEAYYKDLRGSFTNKWNPHHSSFNCGELNKLHDEIKDSFEMYFMFLSWLFCISGSIWPHNCKINSVDFFFFKLCQIVMR